MVVAVNAPAQHEGILGTDGMIMASKAEGEALQGGGKTCTNVLCERDLDAL